MARKRKNAWFKFGIPLLVAVGGWAAFDLVRKLFLSFWEFFGVTNGNAQAILTFAAVLVIIWVSIGAPFSKSGFKKAFDKVL